MQNHLLAVTNCRQHGEIKIFVNLTDVVFGGHRAMEMFMHHGPAHPLKILGSSAIKLLNSHNECVDQLRIHSTVFSHHR